jgi:site-specific recombinase XerD
MHTSITDYLVCLTEKGVLLAVKAARGDLVRFMTWWEKDDAAAPMTSNRAPVTIRAYCAWAKHAGLLTGNPSEELKAIPTSTPTPKSVPPKAVDAILQAVRCEKDARICLRDEAMLALLNYAGLRAQEVCDVQLRDLVSRVAA